ncbi:MULTISPECIES: DUF6602 domain-containing protein [unclassified Providencia]|uniref:DUF6602 domain-containing protein n=1 Tax=unclassified Providencia TaxID=2633465 RepID=UPI00234BAACA|nr:MULTISPECIES: DUF6602 domain-containing protein [unclassified Providencia]
MIKTIADLLQGFMHKEAEKLKEYKLKHGPTIGDMYEGLSKELLERTIPKELELKIVDGFITDGEHFLSGQIDCMLVHGNGEKIPYTNSYKWHVKDVLAVFEIKKNLYSSDLINSFDKLKQSSEGYANYIFNGTSDDNKILNLEPAYKAFSNLTGIKSPNYHERNKLSKENELIYTTIIMEQLMPLKIVIGYDGFSSEHSLRESLVEFIESKGPSTGYAIPSFPHLIICGEYSLVKSTGYPYISPMRNEYWDFMCSSRENPIFLMLEFIWTKLSLEFDINFPWDNSLEIEQLNEFLCAKPVVNSDDSGGWFIKYEELSKKNLEKRDTHYNWEPIEISHSTYIIFHMLSQGDILISSPEFIELANESASSIENFISQIISTTYAVYGDDRLSLKNENIITAILPDGRYVIADNELGRFDIWLSNFIENQYGESRI